MKRFISLGLATAAVAVGLSMVAAAVTMNAAGAQSSDLPTLTIAMDGSSITVGGTLQSGAVDVQSTTTTVASAEPTLFRLNSGVTPDEFVAALNSPAVQDPNSVVSYGSIVFDAEAPKGVSNVQTTLEPAEYMAFDTRKNDPSKWPPPTTFTVTEAATPAELPAAAATVSAIEFGFKGPKTLHDGDVVRFRNDGFVVHMIVGLRARNVSAAAQMEKFLLAGQDGKAGRLVVGFVSFMDPVSHDAVQQVTLDTKPGVYVLACFMSTQDGREHTQLGMERIIKIAK